MNYPVKRITALLSLLVVTALMACTQAGTPAAQDQETILQEGNQSYRNVSATELNSMLENRDLLLINVHVPVAGEIPGTDLAIPYHKIAENLSLLPEDRDAEIVLYCAMGPMSEVAAQTMVEMGFTNVKILDGGLMEWERQN